MKTIRLVLLLTLLPLATMNCVGKFLSTLLNNDGANFKIIEAAPVNNTTIRVSFNKPLAYDKGALDLSNFSLPGLDLIGVVKGPETNQVYLNLDPTGSNRMQRQYYTVTVGAILNNTLDPLLSGAENRSITFMGARWLKAIFLAADGTSQPVFAYSGVAASPTFTVRGDYALGAVYRWKLVQDPAGTGTGTKTWDFTTTAFTASPTTEWSANVNAGTTFSTPTIATNAYRLYAQVQDAQGAWQVMTDLTTLDITVDSTPPLYIGLSNPPVVAPATRTNVTTTNITAKARVCGAPDFSAPCAATPKAPAYYYYRTRYNGGAWSSWSAETNTNIPITYNASAGDGTYDMQVLSRDLAGNFECDIAKISANENDTTACYNGANAYACSFTQYMAGTACTSGTAFNHAATQQLTWVLDTQPNNAAFDATTLPAGTTAATALSVDVQYDAVNTVFYHYRLTGPGQSGLWSSIDKVPMTDKISAAGLTSGVYTIDVIGRDQAGNWQADTAPTTWLFTVDLNAPTAVLSAHANCGGVTGLMTNPRNKNCYDISVGGANVNFYGWKIESGATCVGAAPWTPELLNPAIGVPVATALTNGAAAWVDGQTYSLCVVGEKTIAGPFQGQSDSDVTKLTFTYDITPPSTKVATWLNPASLPTNTIVTDLSVLIGNAGAEPVLAYKGDAYNGACPALAVLQALPEQTIFTPIQKNSLATGATKICYIGRDAAGNYETSVQSTAYNIFTPAIPADGGGVDDPIYANNFNFTWAAHPADATEIRIRVCSDSACASALPGMQNGVQLCNSAATCAATTSYNFKSNLAGCAGLGCINAQNGAKYYAQLRVTDASGNISNYGAVSNGKTVTGGVTGVIRDTNGNAVSGATVGIYNTDTSGNCTTQIGGNLTTGASGSFTFNSGAGYTLPIAQQLAGKGYCVQASTAVPARQGTKKIIAVDAAVDTSVGNVYVVNTTGVGCLYGSIVDGSTGSQLSLSNATFTLKDWNGNVISGNPALDPAGRQFYFPAGCIAQWGNAPYSTPGIAVPPTNNPQLTNSAGTFTSGLNAGVYSLDVAIPGYYNITESAIGVTANNATNVGYLPMVGTFNAGSDQIKVILTWGGAVQDLDLHAVGPTGGTDCVPYNEAAIQDSARFHVYTLQRYCDTSPSTAPIGKVNLAVDSTLKFGPEIMNFYTGYTNGTYKISVYNNDPTAPARSGTLTNLATSVTGLSSTTDILVGMRVTGTGVPANTYVASIASGTAITLSANATVSGAQTLSFAMDWAQSRARVQVYAGDFYSGTAGLRATVGNQTASLLRGWKAFKILVAGTTLTIDDNTGATFGYANWQYGFNQILNGTRTNASPTISGLPTTTGLGVGWAVTGGGIPASTLIAAIVDGTTITLNKNATAGGATNLTFLFSACSSGAPFNINGPSDALTAGAAPPAGQVPKDPNLDCGLLNDGLTTASGAGPLDW